MGLDVLQNIWLMTFLKKRIAVKTNYNTATAAPAQSDLTDLTIFFNLVCSKRWSPNKNLFPGQSDYGSFQQNFI